MSADFVSSDIALLDLLRKQQSMSVSQLAEALHVTSTAVRQRLNRLMAQGYIDRCVMKSARGRPSHRYELTEEGRRKTGSNFADLAIALWEEIREIKDPEVRRGLLMRIASRLARIYTERIDGETPEEKMASIVRFFAERQIPLSVDCDPDSSSTTSLPVLTALACPYPELAERDRGICAMEKAMFAELVGSELRLSQCRLDGETCCTFELSSSSSPMSASES